MFLFKRKKKDDEPVDLEARSPDTGLKYKDIQLLGVMMKQGADLLGGEFDGWEAAV